jgi:hypothetical protein
MVLTFCIKISKIRGIKISDSVYVVKRQIQGTSHEDIEKILIFLRNGKENVISSQ